MNVGINTDVSMLIEYLPFLIPLILAQVVLAVICVIDIIKHPNYRFGNRPLWIGVVVLIQFFGPLLYFFVGREER